jgi:mono/diheme cytochrome c family protein
MLPIAVTAAAFAPRPAEIPNLIPMPVSATLALRPATLRSTARRALTLACTALLTLTVSAAALADERHQGAGAGTPAPAVYVQECGACHVAYPAGLLPQASWQRLMAGLDRHFGVDASLDAAAARQVGAWLQAQGGTSRRARETPPQDRITLAAWFARQHDEVSARTWKLPAVKSPSNCSACHAQAEQGDFNEHAVRIPR